MRRSILFTVLTLVVLNSCAFPAGTASKGSLLDIITASGEMPSTHSSFKMMLLFVVGTVVLIILYYILKKANFVEFVSARKKEVRMDYELKLRVSPREAENWVKSDSDFLLEKRGEQMTVATPVTFCGSLLTLTEKKKEQKEPEHKNESNKAVTSN